MDIGPVSDHSPFSRCHIDSWTLIRLSKCPEETGRVYLWSIHALHLNHESVTVKFSKELAVKIMINVKQTCKIIRKILNTTWVLLALCMNCFIATVKVYQNMLQLYRKPTEK